MIHCYTLGGYYIILDVHSGAVHVVDRLVYDIATQLSPPMTEKCPEAVKEALTGKYSFSEIEEGYNELLTLYEAGKLFSPDDYGPFAEMIGPAPLKAMCLHIAHDCNLRCGYCFASTGDFGGGRSRMPLEVGKKAIDYLVGRSGTRRNLEVDFFGGEPLMNFEVVKEVVDYARSLEAAHQKRFRFTITTNGLLLDDDKIDYINKEMANVVLSIDGRKDINDKMRYRVDGSGCYDSIVPRFLDLTTKRGIDQYYVRGTFTKYNKDFAADVLHLNDLGFDQVSVEPVMAEESQDYALTEADLPEVFAEYEKLADILVEKKRAGKGFNFFHFMLDLDQGPCAIKRLRGCGAGNEYCAVTPDGDVYPCHQFVGQEGWKLGSIFQNSFDEKKRAVFAAATVYSKPECTHCWAKFYCSGGCNANNTQYEGDMHIPHKLSCAMEKKRLECAIMMKAALADA